MVPWHFKIPHLIILLAIISAETPKLLLLLSPGGFSHPRRTCVRNPSSEQGNAERCSSVRGRWGGSPGCWVGTAPWGTSVPDFKLSESGCKFATVPASTGGNVLVLPASPQAGICKSYEPFVTMSCTSVAQHWYCRKKLHGFRACWVKK